MPQQTKGLFRFQQFDLWQDKCAMKFTSAAAMLGAYVPVAGARKILDIGAGSGVLTLMLAQRADKDSGFYAIEIEPRAAQQARENFARSPWSDRLNVVEADVMAWYLRQPAAYDLILSNPPFFHRHLAATQTEKNLARHTQSLEPQHFPLIAEKLLTPYGKMYILIDWAHIQDYEQIFAASSLHLSEKISLWDKENSLLPFAFILGLSRQEAAKISLQTISIRNATGAYTTQYKELFGSYFTIFAEGV